MTRLVERCSILVPLPGGAESWITRTQALELVRAIEEQLDAEVPSTLAVGSSSLPGVRFTIPGAFKPWERARRGRNGGHYTAAESKAAQEAVGVYALRAVQVARSFGVAWSNAWRFALGIRVRWADAKRRDLDNVAKNVGEGLMLANDVVMADDSQIDRLVVERAPIGDPGIEIVLRRKG